MATVISGPNGRARRFLKIAPQAVLRIDVVGRSKGRRAEASRTTPVLQ